MTTFTAIIFKEGMLYLVEVPSEIGLKLGATSHMPVRGLADNKPFKSTCVPRKDNRLLLFMNSETRAKLRKTEGDQVELQIEFDPDSREIPLPEDVEMILAEDESILKEFLNLSPSYRREITKYILKAKREETRLKRIQLIANRMRERILKRS